MVLLCDSDVANTVVIKLRCRVGEYYYLGYKEEQNITGPSLYKQIIKTAIWFHVETTVRGMNDQEASSMNIPLQELVHDQLASSSKKQKTKIQKKTG